MTTVTPFVRWYRVVSLLVAGAWRVALLFATGGGLELGSVILAVGVGLLPFAALGLLAGRIAVPWVLVLGAAALLVIDVFAAIPAIEGRSSTDAVGVVIAPLVALVTVVPATGLVGWGLGRLSARR